MDLPVRPPHAVLEAQAVDQLPRNSVWQYEPKWDGFRCLAFRDRDTVYLQSRNAKPLGRYFPDVVKALGELNAQRFVLDGELVVPVERRLSFEQLQLRLHPAASRVSKLAAAHPAALVVFDLLMTERRQSLTEHPLEERRERLEKFSSRYLVGRAGVRLSPASRDEAAADRWFRITDGSLDGIIAKDVRQPYSGAAPNAVVKFKNLRTADCVVAGFRYASRGGTVGSLLLGLYDDEGLLHHVGYTSSLSHDDFEKLTPRLEKLCRRKDASGFTGRSPGAPSRWSTERSARFESLPPQLVVEVQYDHVTGDRFRHGTSLVRWRPDKDARRCHFRQILPMGGEANLFEEAQ
jgi:ATP-dependent DNA ligase